VKKVEVGKTCNTCGHRQSGLFWDTCALSGYDCSTERRYPTQCGKDFAGWIPRNGIFGSFKAFFVGTKLGER
jgi:hypothetical protein